MGLFRRKKKKTDKRDHFEVVADRILRESDRRGHAPHKIFRLPTPPKDRRFWRPWLVGVLRQEARQRAYRLKPWTLR